MLTVQANFIMLDKRATSRHQVSADTKPGEAVKNMGDAQWRQVPLLTMFSLSAVTAEVQLNDALG